MFLFGLFEKYIYDEPTEAERELTRQVQRYWTAFARGESLDDWKPNANGSDPVLHLDTPSALRWRSSAVRFLGRRIKHPLERHPEVDSFGVLGFQSVVTRYTATETDR